MAKETNHRRKSKTVRKVEELDVESLTKELVKPKPQPRKPKNDYQKDRREPQHNDKRKDFKSKPKQNNQQKDKRNENNQQKNEKNNKPYNKNKKNYKPKNDKGNSK